MGTRLGALTTDIPKALVTVADRTLLAHALHFAAHTRPSEIVVVGGRGFPDVAAELEGRRAEVAAPVTLVENRSFQAGNVLSLLAARPHLREGFLLMNVDHIYPPAVAALVAAPVEDVTAFIDTDRRLGDDDMKVERDEAGRVRHIAKTLTRFDAGYVGMTRVPDSAVGRYFAEVDAARAADGDQIHVERVLARLAQTARPPLCRDISGHGWLEVDTPDERARAEEILRERQRQ